MKVDAQTLLDALEGRLSASQVASLTEELRALSPAAILTLAQAGGISITGDGNIVGNNNISIVVKGEGAAELASVLREALYRGRALYQLRPPVGDFVGRETEIQELMTALRSNQAAAISGISGMGGIGKTELALYVADKLRAEYPEAQLFVSLRGTDPVPRAAADALQSCLRALVGLEAKLPDDVDELAQLYRSQLSGKRALILLDNAADSAQVKPLLPPTGCALLVTSRTVLALPGSKRLTLDQLQPAEARTLLLSIAPHLTADVADSIAYLCGYLPLALRAAGSLLAVTMDLEPAEYVAQLREERTRLETIGDEEIELSVAATFQLSYVRLSDEAARVFRTLSVMQGSFDGSAAEAIAEDARHAHLSELVKRSLVQYDGPTKRYRLHDLTRLFAAARLNDEERLTAERQHATHYKTVLATAHQLYRQGHDGVLKGLALYEQEASQITAGQAWAVAWMDAEEAAAQLCIGYPDAGVDVLELRQHPRERIAWLEAMLAAARQLQRRDAEAAALGNLGNAYRNLGEVRRAIEHYEQVLQIAREIGDRRGEGAALGNLGNAYANLGEVRRAIEYHEQRLQIAREIGDRRGEGNALGNLGLAYADLGEVRRAIEFYEQSLQIARELGDRRGEGNALGNLGLAYANLGEVRRAIEFYEQVLQIAREIGDRRSEGAALGNLGNAYFNLGEVRRAIEHYEQVLQIAREIGDRHGEGAALGNLGNAYRNLGEVRRAIEHYEQVLQIAREIGDRRGEGAALGNLGNAYFNLGEVRRAIGYYEQHVQIAREIGDRRGEGTARWNMALAWEKLGDRAQAIVGAEAVLLLFEQIENPNAAMVRRGLAEWKTTQPDEGETR